jgi:hypothetical protein
MKAVRVAGESDKERLENLSKLIEALLTEVRSWPDSQIKFGMLRILRDAMMRAKGFEV